MRQLYKYLKEKGFICSYDNKVDRASLWKSIDTTFYWQVDMEGDKMSVAKFSNLDVKYSHPVLREAHVESIAELAVIIKIFNLTNEKEQTSP